MKTPHTPHTRRLATVTAALVALASPVFAQEPAAAPAAAAPATTAPLPPAAKPKPLDATEKKFIKDISEQHQVEQKILNVAKQHASSEAAKGLHNKISADLAKSWEALATVAMAKEAQLVTEVKAADKTSADRMAKLEGDRFDKEFLKDLEKEAKRTAKIVETAEKAVRDPELKAFIASFGPSLKGHPMEIDAAEKAMKGK
jgi:putative membrane protein